MEDISEANNDMESNGAQENSNRWNNEHRYVTIRRSGNINELTQCPICLGILRNTRTVMECLHRFCRECIDKAIRLGKNECPTCRAHCASRRSLRDDPQFDALIAALYPDLQQVDEEEFTLVEENLENNKKTQGRIAEVFKRQSEALVRLKRQKPVGTKAGVAVISRRAESELQDRRQSSIGQSYIHPDLTTEPAESSATKDFYELCCVQGVGNETTKARVGTVSGITDWADGRPNDIGANRYRPFRDLKRSGAEFELSTTRTSDEVCLAHEENETTHGLQLLSDLANIYEASKFTEAAAGEWTKIKDDKLPRSTEDGSLKKRKGGPGSSDDNSFATSSEHSVAVHIDTGDLCEGQNKEEVLPSSTGHRALGTAKSNVLFQPVDNDHGQCTRVDKEKGHTKETQFGQESESMHDPLALFTYERPGRSSTGESDRGKAQTQVIKPGRQKRTERESRSDSNVRSSKRESLCSRASALLKHLVASARDEEEEKFDIQLWIKPLLERPENGGALYLSCPPRMKIQHLCEYLANKIPALQGRNIEISVSTSSCQTEPSGLQQPENTTKVHVLRIEYTLQYVWSNLWHNRGNMVLLYRGLVLCLLARYKPYTMAVTNVGGRERAYEAEAQDAESTIVTSGVVESRPRGAELFQRIFAMGISVVV